VFVVLLVLGVVFGAFGIVRLTAEDPEVAKLEDELETVESSAVAAEQEAAAASASADSIRAAAVDLDDKLLVMGEAIEIRREGDRLIAKGKQGEAEIFPESETEFHSKEGPVRISFAAGEDGRPVRAILTLMGLREFHLTRLP